MQFAHCLHIVFVVEKYAEIFRGGGGVIFYGNFFRGVENSPGIIFLEGGGISRYDWKNDEKTKKKNQKKPVFSTGK